MLKQTMKQAEVKDRKFGERLTGNADANPEPSPENWEGVETRHGLCVKCDGQIPSGKYKNAKYCSKRCRDQAAALRYAYKTGRIKNPGVGSGGAQLGENNHMYKNGIGTFRSRALEYYGKVCNRCKSIKDICVHHKDEDRTNNHLDNLEVICKKCHQEHHCIRDLQGRYAPHIKG